MTKQSFFRLYLPLGIGIAIVGVIAGVLLMDKIIMPLAVGKHRGNAIVPRIINITPNEARKLLKEAGLNIQKDGEEYSDSIQPGSITSQKPGEGKEVKKGRTVYYMESRGAEVVKVPELKGVTLRQAQVTLKRAGLETGKVRYSYDENIPTECIISSTPDPGVSCLRGSMVDLLMSRGKEPTDARVPNLVGESLENSTEALENSGVELGTVTYRVRKELVPNTIISQSLAPGSKVDRGAKINLVVSSLE